MSGPDARGALGTGAFVGAACAACCAPPIIAALGLTLGLAAVAGLIAGIAAAVAVVIIGTGVIVGRRRTRRIPHRADDLVRVPVAVAPPTRRPPPAG